MASRIARTLVTPAALLWACCAATGIVGCSSGSSMSGGPSRVTVQPSDFQAAVPAPDASAPPTVVEPAPGQRDVRAVTSMTVQSASDGAVDISAYSGPPKGVETAPPSTGETLLLDSLVGQINGRPVIASTFLEPLDGRLRQLRVQYPDRDKWSREAARIIYEQLRDKIRDELLLAEAMSKLSPEMRDQGIRYFLGQLRGDLAREAGGSAELADSLLAASEGVSIDQKSREKLDKELIKSVIGTNVSPRVNVSSRDIAAYYEKNLKQFNPDPIARFRLIRVSDDDSAAKTSVAEALASGMTFEAVASTDTNAYRPEHGGLHEIRLEGPLEQAKPFGLEELSAAAVALTPGQTAGPMTIGSSTYWVHLETIDRKPAVSQYEAQLQIHNTLQGQKFNRELDRYFKRLLERGSYSDIMDMTVRLVHIASDRYLGSPS